MFFRLRSGRHVCQVGREDILAMPGDIVHSDRDLVEAHGSKFEAVESGDGCINPPAAEGETTVTTSTTANLAPTITTTTTPKPNGKGKGKGTTTTTTTTAAGVPAAPQDVTAQFQLAVENLLRVTLDASGYAISEDNNGVTELVTGGLPTPEAVVERIAQYLTEN